MCDAGGDPGAEVGEVLAAVRRLRARPRDGRSQAEVAEELVRLRHACDLLELEFATVAAEFAGTDEYDVQGSVSPISWIRHHCRMSGHAAAGAVCVGEQAANLPRSMQAVADGGIGYAHLALLASTARGMTEAGGVAHFDEAPLLDRALEHSVGRFRVDCAHARHAGDAAGFLAEQVDSVEARRLELVPGEGGALFIRGVLDAVGGASLRTALEPLARRSGAGDDRLRARRYADALVELASHGLDHGVGSGRGGHRAHLQVTASLETLRGLPGAPAGELERGGPVATATVQRLACDAGIRRILLGPDSAVVDVGRTRRLPAPATRRALELRDKGCAWPGCDRPASWTQAHHLRHWAHRGVTETDNLVLLCHRHHWMVHEGGWRVVRTDEQSLVTIPPLPVYGPPARGPDLSTAA